VKSGAQRRTGDETGGTTDGERTLSHQHMWQEGRTRGRGAPQSAGGGGTVVRGMIGAPQHTLHYKKRTDLLRIVMYMFIFMLQAPLHRL
jgi:hypothetical protein